MGIPLYVEPYSASPSRQGGPVVKLPASCPYVEAFAGRRDGPAGSSTNVAVAPASHNEAAAARRHHHHHHHHHDSRIRAEIEERQARHFLAASQRGVQRLQTRQQAARSRSQSTEMMAQTSEAEARDALAATTTATRMTTTIEPMTRQGARDVARLVRSQMQEHGTNFELHMDMETGETWATSGESDEAAAGHERTEMSEGRVGLAVEAAIGHLTAEERESIEEELSHLSY